MTEAMKVETLERLMTGFKPTPELDEIFSRGLTSDTVTTQEMEKLEAAGYVGTDDEGEHNITEPARKYAWANLPEQSKVFRAKVDALEAKEQEKRKKEQAKQQRIHDQQFADTLVKQGLLVIKDGRYHNTPKGWEDALSWLQFRINGALDERHRDWLDYQGATIESRSGDFENVPVSQPWRYHDNQLIIKRGFNRVRKKILESLTDEELELFGRSPKSDRLNRPATEAKARLVEALTRCQEGATDLVRKGSCQ